MAGTTLKSSSTGPALLLNVLNVLCIILFAYFTYTNFNILTFVEIYIIVSVIIQVLMLVSLFNVHPRKISNVMEGIICWIGSSLVFHTIAVLYGAPLFSSVSETFHLAMLLATTAALPGLMVLGIRKEEWTRLFFKTSPSSALEISILASGVCSVLGAWLGAFPIPLDWDRPWQVWPISCVIGTLAGYSCGLIFATCFILYQNMKGSKSKLF
ncbi:phosphatidylinositol-glycan biosynthesis class F protein isoform X2 [Lingula anatina]|uniref:Phosphatidylinositol-glycan biosynthesis class F protein isoform X2 n=1 Tax=Lingula anatina TaxID=7574 RepID=A0A1S3HKR6_LINAN|nr:phosphatidylinositol-glycan biosynthesis class F protein isoform X2 [Lingula anatina]|eukprot:XP_013386612.1 phosphatidylinositol-glycan biosynthesis class F protein isoform X2 [Lingula anatina]